MLFKFKAIYVGVFLILAINAFGRHPLKEPIDTLNLKNANAVLFSDATKAFTLENVEFKRLNTNRTYSITLPTVCEIKFKNKKSGKIIVPKPSYWKHVAPIITHMTDSLLTVKYHKPMTRQEAKEFNEIVQELKRSKALTREEKEFKYFMMAYPDSVIIPLDSLRSMRFSRFNSVKKKFYSDFRAGFNEQRNPEMAQATFRFITLSVGIYVLATVSAESFPIAFTAVAAKVLIWDLAGHLVSTKNIRLNHWKPIKQGV